MLKTCNCGQRMKLELRKLIHERRTRICHVPVYACQNCKRHELLPLIKADLVRYLTSLSDQESSKIRVSFADVNEPAHVLREVFRTYADESADDFQVRCKEAFDERINMLLDLFRYAQTMKDADWMKQIEGRLEQVSTLKTVLPENSSNFAR
ncbi:hypothetical protein [Paenibacillus sp. JCM 10914]|uniref:hypothetical protein n=1 Tax=Paenibacillus sp. JCM 10914 TaxID=1236974 RepID=UPI00055E055F|nr:hypothetical protein [Paenibacillus sp. JCM 10914]